jgi:putative NADH-flavin reductase
MKLVVVGAASPTGSLLVQRAKDAGHKVVELVRAPAEGDLDGDGVAGADAVVFLAGEPGRSTTVTRTVGMSVLVRALRAGGDSPHVLTVSPADLEISEHAPLARRLRLRLFDHKRNRNRYLDFERMEDLVRGSDLDWTLVRVPRLRDGAATGRYRVTDGGYLAGARAMDRTDLVDYLLAHAGADSVRRRVIALGGSA